MAQLLKVVKDDLERYIRTEQLSAYQEAGWTLDEEIEITLTPEEPTQVVRKKVKVAE